VRPDGELDYGSRLLSEIEEELGLGAPVEPTFTSPLGLVLDDGTVEVVVWMQVAADLSLRGGNGEDRYTDVQWIPIAELERFRAEHSKEMVPLSSWLAGLIASQGLGRIARVS
jgi:8-oxo-dGTP pyrophosphatase MutT (NUDIX family)